jgi:hypothetical protein
MGWLKAVLVGLVAGVLLTIAVFAVEAVRAERSMSAQMADCEAALNGGGGVCSGYAQMGGNALPVAFVLGFVAGCAWFLRRHSDTPLMKSSGDATGF